MLILYLIGIYELLILNIHSANKAKFGEITGRVGETRGETGKRGRTGEIRGVSGRLGETDGEGFGEGVRGSDGEVDGVLTF